MNKINVLIIGNGHYATGCTVLERKKETDKDLGVVLPSVLEIRKQGLVNEIYLAARNSSKFPRLREKLKFMREEFSWNTNINLFPNDDEVREDAYVDALKSLPEPRAVIIATPDYLHKDMVLEVIKHKSHFLVVKPAVTRLKDLEEILKKQKETRVFGMVDYHKVFDEANLVLRDEYNKGVYGKLYHVFSKMTQRRDMIKIFSDWLKKGETNVNHYLGSHYIHLTGFITDASPLNVRATRQYGIAKSEYGVDTPDIIETQVEWKAKDGTTFVSYHIAGWADPSETAAMTYQEIHMIGSNGHIESDQRFRGYETTLIGKGQQIINPYFFHLNKSFDWKPDLSSKYGFKSIKSFVEASLAVSNGVEPKVYVGGLPTIEDSRKVTVILEAADESLKNNSAVIEVKKV